MLRIILSLAILIATVAMSFAHYRVAFYANILALCASGLLWYRKQKVNDIRDQAVVSEQRSSVHVSAAIPDEVSDGSVDVVNGPNYAGSTALAESAQAPLLGGSHAMNDGELLPTGTVITQETLLELEDLRSTIHSTAEKLLVLAEELTLYHTFTDITRSQLRDINEESGKSTISAMERLQRMDERMRAIFVSIDDLEGMTALARERVSQESNLLANEQKRGEDELDGIFHEVERLLPYIKEVQDVAQRIRILALNATIEAAHAGQAGLGFSVIGREVSDLSRKSSDLALRIQDDIHATVEELNNRVTAINERSRSRNIAIYTTINETCESNARFASDQRQRAQMVEAELTDTINSLLGGAQQQDVSRQQIENIDRAIGALDEHSQALASILRGERPASNMPKVQEILDGLYERYVMESQRRAHGLPGNEQPATQESAIELF